MRKKILGLFIVVLLFALTIGVFVFDETDTTIYSNNANSEDIVVESEQVSQETLFSTPTQEDELTTPPDEGLTAKALNTLGISTSSYYYLDQDWTESSAFSKSLTISGASSVVYLDLRGYSMSISTDDSIIKINSGKLVLFDSVGGGTITGAYQSYYLGGGGIYVAEGASLELYSGVTICDNETETSTYLGGGIYNAGTFDMYGGAISNNISAGIGGGVYNKGTFNMYGGEVSYNEAGAGNYGAGVYNAGTFNMSGGTITENVSTAGGAGVSNVGTMTMSGGYITDNTASGGGAGIFVGATATLTISGGEISGNTAGGNGGGITISGDSAVVTISGGTITDNTASGNGGGIYFNKAELYVSGEVTITDNEKSSGATNNVYVVEGQEIVVVGDVDGEVGVTYATSTGTIVVGEGYTINEATATCFVSDNEEYYCIWDVADNQMVLEGDAEIGLNEEVVESGSVTIVYDEAGYDVSNMFDTNELANVIYTVTNLTGTATLASDGKTLQIESIGTFEISAFAEATIISAAAKGTATLTVEAKEVYITDIEALSRGVDEHNIFVDLDVTTGTIKDADGAVIDAITLDYSSAYGVIDDIYYYDDETLNGEDAHNDFTVTVANIKLSGTYSGNYVIAEVAGTTVEIYAGYPLVSWPTVSDIAYGDTIDNDSLIGGKLLLKVGDDEYITVEGSFEWVTTPTAEDVGSYSHAVQFVVDTTSESYEDVAEYVTTIESLISYVSYEIDPIPVTFSISDNVIEVNSTSQPTITATANGEAISSDDYEILYFQLDGGVVYYSFEGSAEGDGSASNPYLLDTSTEGTYLIGAELSSNYHHSGTVENSAKQIGVLYVGSSSASYSVTFNDSNGDEISSLSITDSYIDSIIIMPSYDDGIGWVNAKGVFYEFGDRYPQPEYDETFTLVSAYEIVNIAGTVYGTDLDGNEGYLDSIMVEIIAGSTIVATTVTDANGAFAFDVEAGNYTLVVTRNTSGLTNIITVMVEAETSVSDIAIILPSTRSNVVLEVYSGFTDITASGLEALIPETENTITIYVDKAVTNGTEQTAILALAQEDGFTISNVKLYYDINFTEQPSSTEVAMTELAKAITFYIPIQGIYQYKESYVVYVYDDYGNAYVLDSDSYTCDENGTMLTITTKVAGVYALAFVDVIETFEGTEAEETYSAETIDLSAMFSDLGYYIEGATYELGESSTGEGTIIGSLLYVDKVGDFEIIITTKETATAYSAIGTATLTVAPATITVEDVLGVERGLVEDDVTVEIDISNATISGAVSGDNIALNFDNAYGVIVTEDGTTYYYSYDDGADSWVNQQATFDVMLVGVSLYGADSANYVLDYSYTTVTITTTLPHVAWASSTSIAYGEDLSDATLYGGKVVIYDGGDYIEFATDDCNFTWDSETTYIDDFGNSVAISELSAGTYTQKVTVSIKETATGYDALYNEELAEFYYYVTFEIVADSVQFEISGNVVAVGDGLDQLAITAITGSGKDIASSDYEIVFFKLDNGVVYYSLTGSVDGDGSYGNPYLLTSDTEDTYLIGALFNYSADGVYNYHHSGSTDSTAKQIGTLYITNATIATYTATFTVYDATYTTYDDVTSGDILILPTLDNDNYIGWSYNGVTYAYGARFAQPAYDVEFTAVEAPETYEVSGTITGLALGLTEGESTAISGVGVALYQGSELIATTSTDANGEYTFDVAIGRYSLVVTRTQGIENIITIYLEVTGVTEVDTIDIPNIRQNTIVSVDSGVEAVTVDGIDDLHSGSEENTYTVTVTDASANVVILDEMRETALEYGITHDDMKVYLNISLTDDNGNISDLDGKQLTFYITLAGLYQGYDNYYVYRYHTESDGTISIERISTTANEYGEYIELSDDGTTLILHVSRFSVFGIAFQDDFEIAFGDTVTYSEYGDTIVAPSAPTKDSTLQYTYTFKEWNTVSDGTGTAFSTGETVTGDITYYAIFTETAIKYTITFDDTKTYLEYGDTIVAPNDPTKDSTMQYNYTFKEWNTNAEGTGTVFSTGETVTGDVTYYAIFTATERDDVFTVTFSDYTATYMVAGSTIIAPSDPTKTATAQYTYTFVEWNTVSDGTGTTFSTGDTVTGDVTYYAIFTAETNSYSVTFEGNSAETLDYGSTITAPSSDPTKATTVSTIYTFAGWSLSEGGAIVSNFGTVTGNVTYYAVFTETTREYTVIFDIDGEKTELVIAYGATVSIASPTKDDYTFAGWIDNDGDTFLLTTKITGDITLTATWTEIEDLTDDEVVEEEEHACWCCGACPTLLGICYWIWLIIIIIIMLCLIAICVDVKDKRKEKRLAEERESAGN